MDTSQEFSLEELKELISDKNIKVLREVFEEFNVVDMSELVGDLELAEALFIFKTLKKEITSEIFSYLPHDKQEVLITAFTGPEIKEMLDNLYSDDILDFIEEMPANIVKHVLSNASPQQRAEINKLLSYEDNSAGSIMTTDFVILKKEDDVHTAIEKVRKQGRVAETINYCYVTDSKKVLAGYLALKDLLFSNADEKISDIMDEDLIYVKTRDDQEEVARKIEKYDITAIPVVNDDGCLVGIVTVDDIIDVIHEEATEDIHKMNAITPLEDTYLETGVFTMAKSRIVWLLILMISATITGNIMMAYEGALEANVILSAFIPMLMDAAGNAGNQASTMIIRALAMGEVHTSDILRIWFKESRVALICGSIMSVVNYLRIVIFMPDVDPFIALVVSVTVFITVIIAKFVGSTLPVVAVKLKQDPAVMAGPLITTLVDAISLFVYFQFAMMFLV